MKKFKTITEAANYTPKIADEVIEKNLPILGEFLLAQSEIPKRDTGDLEKSCVYQIEGRKLSLIADDTTPYARMVYYVTAISGDLKWFEVAVRKNKKRIPKIVND
jgi:hypothetical protein